MSEIFRRLFHMLPREVRIPITEYNELCRDRKNYTKEAKKILSQMKRTDAEEVFRAWLVDFKKYRVSFTEYWDQYHFPERSDTEKAAYMSAGAMRSIYRRKVDLKSRERFWHKEHFLAAYSEYVHREWMNVTADTDILELQNFLNRFDVILKPLNGTHGQGVRKLSKGADLVAEELIGKELIIEQCVTGEATIQAFHPHSLNTIRVAMFTDGKSKCRTMWSVLRTGNHQSCIDNTHGGGISSLIDVNTGIVISDGQCNGASYEKHPVSGIQFKGFQIPYWDLVIRTCKEAALKYPNTYFVGWDVAIWEDGTIELIEGNHAPDVDGVQTLLGRGIKSEILKSMRELH